MKLDVRSLDIPEVRLIGFQKFGDARGYFAETYRVSSFAEAGIDAAFVQENQAFTGQSGTIRGLHFQAPPHAQAKLVRVLRGAILDVALDIRVGSPTYGGFVSAELTPDNGYIFVPHGFAHGYCTLTDDTEIVYKCDAYYHPGAEGGVHFADPDLGIPWPVGPDRAVVSDKDGKLPPLSEIVSPFRADAAD